MKVQIEIIIYLIIFPNTLLASDELLDAKLYKANQKLHGEYLIKEIISKNNLNSQLINWNNISNDSLTGEEVNRNVVYHYASSKCPPGPYLCTPWDEPSGPSSPPSGTFYGIYILSDQQSGHVDEIEFNGEVQKKSYSARTIENDDMPGLILRQKEGGK